MNFEKDIFISYAHLDEKEMTMDEMGWITAFHKNLEKQVGDYLGEKPVIWRDSQLQGNDRFDEEIVGQFPKLRVMVSVISPRYVKSDWCLKEVDGFYDVANKNLGFYVGNKGRIFKVIKTPVPLEKIPDKIKPMLEYPFFTKDRKSTRLNSSHRT